MIQANELRIGNFVEWNKGFFKCCQIFNNYVENELWCKPLEELHPIEITDQILIKFGFERCEHNFSDTCFQKDDFDFEIIKQGDKWVLSRYTNEECSGCFYFAHNQLKYVHQLQNLYFAITGEELKF